MNTEDRIRQCFREIREDDAHRVPPFRRVARPPVRPLTVPWLRLAAAAVVVVAAVVVLVAVRRPPAAVDTKQWEALSNWHATTDELLTVSSTPWGSSISTPTDSWIPSTSQERQ